MSIAERLVEQAMKPRKVLEGLVCLEELSPAEADEVASLAAAACERLYKSKDSDLLYALTDFQPAGLPSETLGRRIVWGSIYRFISSKLFNE